MKRNILLILTALTSLFITKVNYGQAPNLGTAASFGVFTSVGLISNTGSTTINGDFGNFVGGSTGTPPIVNGQTQQTNAIAQQAGIDVCAAYTEAQAAPCDRTVALLGEGQIITPGVTCVVAASTVTGNLVLDAQGDPNAVFIIRVNGVLNTGAGSQIVLTNGGNECNVFFTVLGAVNLGANSVFNGTILESGGAASIGANAVINGRLLDCVGAINLDNNTINNPCASTPPCPTIAAPTATVTQPTCTVATGTITVTSPTTGLTFSLNSTDTADFTNTTGVFGNLDSGTFVIRTRNAAGCISAGLTVTINAAPAAPLAPVFTVTQPTCTVSTGTVTVTSPTTGLTFRLIAADGTVINNSTGVFVNLASGTYNIRVRNAAGCLSVRSTVTINAQPTAPAAPTATVTQPTCTVATGAITVTSPTTGLTFSLNSTDTADFTNTTGVFANLAPGTNIIRAISAAGCISAGITVIVNAQPAAPAAPIATVTQPTCAVATGTISVTSGTTGLTFSLNSTDPADFTNTTGVFSNLAPGTNIIRVRNAAGCISAGLTVTVNAQPDAPAAPTTDVTQPTCTVATGTITVISGTTGSSFTLSGNGTTITSTTGVFGNLTSGTYTIRFRNADGCLSAANTVTINAQPAAPDAPTVNVTSPTCLVATGTISVTSGTTGLTFSLNSTSSAAFTNTTGVFSNLAPGTYIIRARNAGGCISSGETVIVNAPPAPPATPSVIVTQPTCEVGTGTIKVACCIAGLTFSINSTSSAAFTNTTGIFSNLAPGTYIIRSRNAAGCISIGCTIVVTARPTTNCGCVIATPTGSATQPTCLVATGTIRVTSAITGLRFSINNTSSTSFTNTTGVFSNLASGTYVISARNAAGCISAGVTIVVNARPATPTTPTGTTTQPTCTVGTGSIKVTSGITGLRFSINSTSSTSFTNTTGVFSSLTPGTYIIRSRNAAGCVSAGLTKTVNPPPANCNCVIATPTGTTTQPTCIVGTGTIKVTSGITGLKFSINSTSSSSFTNTTGVFSNLAPGTYTIRSRNSIGCVSASLTKVINAKPANPAAPTVSVTQPTCTVATGTLKVTSGITGLKFSINSTSSSSFTNTTGVFSNLVAGTYIIRYKTAAGCISNGRTVTVYVCAAAPGTPTVGVTQPTCAVGTGTIRVSCCITGLRFSINSTSTFTNTTGVFSNLAPGTYTIRSRNASGCISPARTVVVNARPTNCISARSITSVENAEKVSTLSVKVGPNPYTDKVRFVIESPISGKANLDVYNLLGQKLQNVYQGHINAGASQTVDFNVPATMRTHLIYIFDIGGRRVSGRILKQ